MSRHVSFAPPELTDAYERAAAELDVALQSGRQIMNNAGTESLRAADFKFACPSCAQHIACERVCCGLQIDCPACHARIRVPHASADPSPRTKGPASVSDFKFTCPRCGQHIACEQRCCGLPIDCPACGVKIKVPERPPNPVTQGPVSVSMPAALSPPAAPLSLVQSSSPDRLLAVTDVKRLSSWFTLFWVCLLAGAVLSLPLFMTTGFTVPTRLTGGEILVVAWFCCAVAAVISYCLILHKLWTLIPANTARTTPVKAVGLLFIPLFNFYWNFVAFHGLAESLNALLRKSPIRDRVGEGLSLAYCILMCFSVVPMVGTLAALVGSVFWIVALRQMKDAGIALLQQGMGQSS
mgnify:CR=1 FL=1